MNRKPRILFVDDEPRVLRSIQRSLLSQTDVWDLQFCEDPLEAVSLVDAMELDTLVTDVRMPGIDGLELVARVRAMPHRQDLPIVVLTGNAELDLKRRALDVGATDLLNKPVSTEDLLARLRSTLTLKRQADELRQHNEHLEELVSARTQELADSRLDILWRLGKAAEQRDEDTGHHVIRVSLYCRLLAEELGLAPPDVEQIFLASPLHDVGKIGIPDAILLKPGKLTDEEWVVMRTHCQLGYDVLVGDSLGMALWLDQCGRGASSAANPLLATAAQIALSHHEKFDGSGYPGGLSGERIPLTGRIVALADVFDALSSERPYKAAFPEERVLAILREQAGHHFDPAVHKAFLSRLDDFRTVRDAYGGLHGDGAALLPGRAAEGPRSLP